MAITYRKIRDFLDTIPRERLDDTVMVQTGSMFRPFESCLIPKDVEAYKDFLKEMTETDHADIERAIARFLVDLPTVRNALESLIGDTPRTDFHKMFKRKQSNVTEFPKGKDTE
jgi:hypothetical protein